MASPGPKLRTPWREVLLAALPAALHAVFWLGRLHPDELFQVLEPGLNRAFGFGVMAWEWQVGLRNWALPGLVSFILQGADKLGIHNPWAWRALIEVPQYFLHAAMLAAVWRLSARRVGIRLARWCLWLLALYGPLVWFGGRTMSEALSTALLVWGLERLDADEHRPTVAAWAGVLLGLAQVARYGSAALILPALLWLLATRRFKDLGATVAGGALVAVGLGLLDKLTWGATLAPQHFAGEGVAVRVMNAVATALPGWWHSFFLYVNFNVISGEAARRFGEGPWFIYLVRLFLLPASFIGLWQWWARPPMRVWLFAVPAAFYVAVISATPHKEVRFVYPALILLAAAGLPAFAAWASELWMRRTGTLARAALAALALGGVAFFIFPSPYDVERAEQFQLSAVGGREATGMVIVGEGLWGSPGFFYLGKNIPWFTCDFPEDPRFQGAMRDATYNRMQTWDDHAVKEAEAFGFRVLERRGHGALLGR